MAMIEDYGLRERLKHGNPVTLVLGAGVSFARGLPLWPELLRRAWEAAFGEDPYALDVELLERAQSVCRREGLPTEFLDRLDVRRHPFELQFAFEEIFSHLRWSASDERTRKRLGLRPRARRRDAHPASNEQRASELFADLLRKVLYRGLPRRSRMGTKPSDTLSLIAQAVRRSAMSEGHQRLIVQVITFNVDDLLEREVNAGCRRYIPYAVPICRASALRPLPVRRAIAIYHLHGFIPMDSSQYPYLMEDGAIEDVQPPAESLVFTDEQYWRAVGNPSGFASRVFSSALSGHCLFIGLSMTDLNIIRWLAQDAIERSDDFRRLTSGWSDPTEVEYNMFEELSRHYWITEKTPGDRHALQEPIGARVLRNTLDRRGVVCIDIPSWESREFQDWWKARFLS
jgi:hypothetical protein